MIKFIFFIIALIFWDPKQENKCFYCVRHGMNSVETQKLLTCIETISLCCLYILWTRSWGLKSTFITTGTFKEAITEIENYWYDDQNRCYVYHFPSICIGVQNSLLSFNCLFLPYNTFYPLSLVSQPTKTQWPTRNKNKIPRLFLDW